MIKAWAVMVNQSIIASTIRTTQKQVKKEAEKWYEEP